MSHSPRQPTRRRFIAAGALGVGVLVVAGWFRATPPTTTDAVAALDADGRAILRAVAPVMLEGALPTDPADQARALEETLAALEGAIAGLPVAAQSELAQLFTLLSWPPLRLAITRIDVPWSQASPTQVREALDRLRGSSLTLLRAAYDALHQLNFAAWYGNPRSWARIGYPGPPELT